MNTTTPLWRNPVIWLVIGLPLLSIVAGIGLVVMAGGRGNDAVTDRVRRTAQVQTTDLGADASALRGQLAAQLRVRDGRIEVRPVSGRFDKAAPLHMALLHPSQAALDTALTLRPAAGGWQSDRRVDTAHAWNLQLAAPGGQWRLVGRLEPGAHTADLRPALQGAP